MPLEESDDHFSILRISWKITLTFWKWTLQIGSIFRSIKINGKIYTYPKFRIMKMKDLIKWLKDEESKKNRYWSELMDNTYVACVKDVVSPLVVWKDTYIV